jgi:hypothetical protein
MFKKADDADRAGRHDAIVARLFYASSVLMEVTKQFGELTEDVCFQNTFINCLDTGKTKIRSLEGCRNL